MNRPTPWVVEVKSIEASLCALKLWDAARSRRFLRSLMRWHPNTGYLPVTSGRLAANIPMRDMPNCSNWEHPWAVLLAGGDGTRLQSLTFKIAGDSRPKQFCRFFGTTSLLGQTRERLRPVFRRDRELFVVARAHEQFYREDLSDVDDSRILVQPRNRGTGVAVTLALLRILQHDEDSVVAFFPCDHHYSDDKAFALTVQAATVYARQYPESIILLGAEARYPEVEYGWIEPGQSMLGAPGVSLSRVNQFWEKPSLPEASALLVRGCLWNTLVIVGRAEALFQLVYTQIPDVVGCIAKALVCNHPDFGYEGVRAVDFSHDVLAHQPHRLLVVHDQTSGWADLGNPTRVIDMLARNGIKPPWTRGMGLSAE
jgi:mannose-1-phosphate guanylyltransferase